MKQIKIKKDVNLAQIHEELKLAGINVEGIAIDKNNNLDIKLIDNLKEQKLRDLISAHVKRTEKTLTERVDSIVSYS